MNVSQDTVVLGAICHVLNRLRSIDQRLTVIQETVECVVDMLDDEGYDDGDEVADVDSIADSIAAAADDIDTTGEPIPNRTDIADRLREIVESIREEAGE